MKKITNKKIFVTRTFLPPLEEYVKYLEKIWDSRWLTNNGELAQELEKKLSEYLGVKHAIFVSNGTVATQMAIKALDIKKSIITTPFTFIATTSSILWEKCKPVFVDINPNTFCIDTSKIEEAITEDTEAILAVHVYGYPCNVKEIEKIAKKHNLKVIYDAAHAFGVKIDGESIFKFGDISILSLHATKPFHTGEGGLIATNNDELAKKIKLLKDFGLEGENPIEVGINGKNSELHAAMGLANLKYVDAIREVRSRAVDEYRKLLSGTGLHEVKYSDKVEYNSAYFPVVFKSEKELLEVKQALEKESIFPRRYFYPSLNTLPFVKYQSCPISESVTKRVLCLPLYHDLPMETVKKIVQIIKQIIKLSKPTVTIGIPAYNEQGNIGELIKSITSQADNNYFLKEIVINSDASTDNTIPVVKNLAKRDKRIKVIEDKERRGKPFRLNELYKLNNSDFILTLDADVLLKDRDVIDQMAKVLIEDKNAQVVAANLIPTKPRSLTGKVIYANDILWNLTRENINGGDHIANLYGGASMLRRQFSKSFIYPTNISCDEEYLYIKAKEKNGFHFSKDAKVIFKAPETVKEIIIQGRRSLNERNLLIKIFGPKIVRLHDIPFKYKLRGIFKVMLINPIYLPFALLLNLLIRLIPFNDELNSKGMWLGATSTKEPARGGSN